MKRSSGSALPGWSRLALQFGEMWLASLQVIAHRTTRIAVAGPMPNARDLAEFQLMGAEKAHAANEAVMAFVAHLASADMKFGTSVLGDVASGTAALAALSELSESAARLAASGVGPIHARATANARRLGGN
jgi:hypothetical protein